jgi:hypothetical protein
MAVEFPGGGEYALDARSLSARIQISFLTSLARVDRFPGRSQALSCASLRRYRVPV